jgi:hypothetical protein
MKKEEQMLAHEGHRLNSEIDGLFPRRAEPQVPKKAADVLQSRLISGFEEAVEQGMHPADALAIVLSWASSELARIGIDQAREQH